ncbi:MAG: LysE family transporter [Anaerolineales bacterium]
MPIAYFFKGLIIGFSIAAPVGPIGILCIRRTIASGRVHGFLSGLGAATADTFYGFIAAFGLTFISDFFIQQRNWLGLIGGVFLCFLGFTTFLSKPSRISPQTSSGNLLNAYSSTFLLTLTNPLTILSFAAIFAGFGLVKVSDSYNSAAMTVLGVFLGSSCWWFILSWVTSLLRNRINISRLIWVNRIAGSIVFGFGIVAIIGVISNSFRS